MSEKEYIFETMTAGSENKPPIPHFERVKESDLTQKHKDFLLGELLAKFAHAPNEIQLQFLDTIHKNKMHL